MEGDADDVLLLVNHRAIATSPVLSFSRKVAAIADVRGGERSAVGAASFGVKLEPSGFVAYRITYV